MKSVLRIEVWVVFSYQNNYKKFKLKKLKKKIIIVKNIKHSLNNLAIYSRKRIKGKILGITGSLGKTSIKEAIYFILKNKIRVGKIYQSVFKEHILKSN